MTGKRVYISSASPDASQLETMTAALDAWEVTYTFRQQSKDMSLGAGVLQHTWQDAIRQSEVFLRLCTKATASSTSMAQDLQFFRALEAAERRTQKSERRTLLNLILDTDYQREPFDRVTLFIETEGKTRAFWLDELAGPLGVATRARRLTRRSAITLAAAGGITLLSAAGSGALLLRNQREAAVAEAQATMLAFGPGDKIAGQAGWMKMVSPDFVSSTGDANSTVGVATDGKALYAFATNMIRAFTPQGAPLWSSSTFKTIETPSSRIVEVPLPYAGDETLIFQEADAQGNGNLTVVDIASRKLLWSTSVAPALYAGPPTAVGTTLFCLFLLDLDWSVCAFELRTGKVKWSYSIGLGVPHPGVSYAEGKLYIGDPYRCTCLDAETGHKIWQYHLPTIIIATVLLSRGLALFGGLDGYFYALDADSGNLRWRTNLAAPVSAQAVSAGGAIYVGDANGYLWALDVASGRVYWRAFAGANETQDAGTQYAVILYPPVVYRNLVAVVAGDTLSAVDLVSGSLRWPYQTMASNSGTRGMATGPVLLGGHFVIGDSQNHMIAINP